MIADAWDELQRAAEAHTKSYDGPRTAEEQEERLKSAAIAYARALPMPCKARVEAFLDAADIVRAWLRDTTGDAHLTVQRIVTQLIFAAKEADRTATLGGAAADGSGEAHDEGHPHLIGGEFQSDKYPTCPRGKVPLSVKDPTAQDLLWQYAQRRRAVDADFATDLETALRAKGYQPKRGVARGEVKVVGLFGEGDVIGGESLNGYHGVVLFCTPDECEAFGPLIYKVVEFSRSATSDAYGLPNDLRAAKEEIADWRSAIEALGVMGGPDALRKRAVEILSHHDEHHAREDALRKALANILLVRKEGAIRATAKKLGPDYESDHCAHGGMHITNRVFDEARALLGEKETPFTPAAPAPEKKT